MVKKDNVKAATIIQIVLFITFLFLWFISSKIQSIRIVSIVILVIFSFLQLLSIVHRKRICIDKAILLYLLFVLWCILSIVWARDSNAAFSRSVDLICNAVFLVVSYDFFINAKISKKAFISIFVIVGLLFSVYIMAYYGVGRYFAMLMVGRRIGGVVINVNFVGLVCAMTFLIILYSVLNGIYKNKLLLVISIIPLIVAFGSGSRKALIGLAIGIVLILFFYFRGRITRKKIIVSVLVLAALVASFLVIKKLPYFDTVFRRMESMIATLDKDSSEVEGSTYTRELYIKEGLKTFYEYPVTGIGLYNSKYITKNVTGVETYLHCNYVELLACVGIVGFLLYYGIYAVILKKGFNASVKLPVIIIIVFLATEIGAVTYYEIKTAMYFILMLVLLEKTNWLSANDYEVENNNASAVLSGEKQDRRRKL